MPRHALLVLSAGACLASLSAVIRAEEPAEDADLGRYFGFDAPRFIVVDLNAGPAFSEDFNGDGLMDLGIVNNRKSRIELHLQRAEPLSAEDASMRLKVNELPSSQWYERKDISVSHRVSSFRVHDFNGDGRADILYAGSPPELVILEQSESGDFAVASKRQVRGLAAGRDGLGIADVMDGPEPEVLAIVEGRIAVFPISGTTLGTPVTLGSAGGATAQLLAFFVEDYDGNGLKDILGAVPDDAAPLRLWLQKQTGRGVSGGAKRGLIGPELRFEMPPLREADAVRFPGRDAASIGVIERTTRRLVMFDVVEQTIDPASSLGGEREVQAEVRAFADGANSARSVVVADIDADGMLDLLATDAKGNALALHRQETGLGLAREERFSAFKAPKTVAAGQWDGSGPLEVFVLSEEEKAVGVSTYDASADRLTFPEPLPIATPGASPVSMAFIELNAGPAVAVVVQNRRDHALELHRPGGGAPAVIALEGVNRPPQSMLAADIDGDGSKDLLLFTPSEPMVMVRGLDGEGGATVMTDATMPQFGLVQAAGPENTALLDVNGDGRDELLIADQNFVRATSFDATTGWRVVEQVTDPDARTRFVGLTVIDRAGAPAVVVSDKEAGRLVTMERRDGAWGVVDRMRLTGFDPRALHAGAFAGDGQPNILALSDDAFGVIRLGGARAALEEFAAWRSDEKDRLEHEMTSGDLNSDGFVDLVVLDAGEQMAQILTFTQSRRLLEATEFQVYESRLFSGGEEREFEPSSAIIADVTGDGAPDLTLLCHDRLIVYPQMTQPAR